MEAFVTRLFCCVLFSPLRRWPHSGSVVSGGQARRRDLDRELSNVFRRRAKINITIDGRKTVRLLFNNEEEEEEGQEGREAKEEEKEVEEQEEEDEKERKGEKRRGG